MVPGGVEGVREDVGVDRESRGDAVSDVGLQNVGKQGHGVGRADAPARGSIADPVCLSKAVCVNVHRHIHTHGSNSGNRC